MLERAEIELEDNKKLLEGKASELSDAQKQLDAQKALLPDDTTLTTMNGTVAAFEQGIGSFEYLPDLKKVELITGMNLLSDEIQLPTPPLDLTAAKTEIEDQFSQGNRHRRQHLLRRHPERREGRHG